MGFLLWYSLIIEAKSFFVFLQKFTEKMLYLVGKKESKIKILFNICKDFLIKMIKDWSR